MKKKLMLVFWFLFRFNIAVLPFYVLLSTNFSIPQLQTLIASTLHSILTLFGYDVAISGIYLGLISGTTLATIEISMDCTGLKSMYTLAALTFATPTKKKRRNFLLVALPLLFLVNFFRLLAVIVLSLNYGLDSLDTIHIISWYAQIAVIIGFWYFWLKEKGIILGKHKILFR